jgi:hypothetical protein
MRPVSFLLVALVGCPRPAPPAAPGSPAVAATPTPAPVVAPAPSDWPASAPAVPSRRGSGQATDLRALAKAQDIFTVEAALPTLAALDPAGREALIEALAEDPRWRLGLWQGREVAWRRCKTPAGWGTGWGGYCTADNEQWRVMLVLDADPPEDADPAEGGSYRVRAGPSAPDGWRSGTLRAAGPAAWLEIHERATDLGLGRTATALSTLDLELAAMLAGRRGKATAPVTGWHSVGSGSRLGARVDAGAGARVWLRGAEDGPIGPLSMERLRGGDALYEVTLPAAALPADPSTLQLWIQRDDGEAHPVQPDDS